VKFERKEVLKFKQLLHGDQPATFQWFPERKGSKVTPNNECSKLTTDFVGRIAKWNMDGAAITMMVNGSDGRGRKAENVVKVLAVFVDADGQCTLDDLRKAAICPHLIVETSAGRYHAYWLIKRLRRRYFTNAQKQLAEHFHTDPQVSDLARVMRVPGSVNWSHDTPFQVRIVCQEKSARPVSWKKLAKKLRLKAAITSNQDTPAAVLGNHGALVDRIKTALGHIPNGDRTTWLRIGMAIHTELPNEEGFGIWTEWSRSSEKFDAEDQRRTWDAFRTDGPIQIGTLFYLARQQSAPSSIAKTGLFENELELAELFGANYADRLRYVEAEMCWYWWNGIAWRRNKVAGQQLARAFLRELAETAREAGDEGAQKALLRYQTLTALRNIAGHACTMRELQANRIDFDMDPDLLAVKNGVVHLPTRTFRQARAADMVSRIANVSYEANADCPRWKRFMLEIADGDKDFARYLQTAVGYSAFGHSREQRLFVAIGTGANGKGVFCRSLYKVLGEYALALSPSLLQRAYSAAHGPSPALAKINGRRFLMCSEMPRGRSFDEAFVKQLSGSDPISARPLYGDQEEFTAVGKLWLSVNAMPRTRSDDEAMWRRIVPLPFDRQFRGSDADPELEKLLENEASGILNWILEGARRYANDGLKTCMKSRENRRKLRKVIDSVAGWLDSACRKDLKEEVQAETAFRSYSEHVRTEKGSPMSRAEFKAAMERKGFKSKKRNKHNVYLGLELLDGNRPAQRSK